MTEKRTWTAKNGRALTGKSIAYFSASSGCMKAQDLLRGLGILAGDHANPPATWDSPGGITLFYRQGYFQQVLSGDGCSRNGTEL